MEMILQYFLDKLKEQKDGFFSFIDGILDFLKKTGVKPAVDAANSLSTLRDKAADIAADAEHKADNYINPDLALAAKTAIEKTHSGIEKIKPALTKLGLNDSAIAEVVKLADGVSTTFFKENHDLDSDTKSPVAAVGAGNELHNAIVERLAGDGKDKLGLLAAINPDMTPDQRKAKAEEAADIVAGQAENTDPSAALHHAKNGMVRYYEQVQIMVNDPNFKKGSLSASALSIDFDPNGLPDPTPPPGNPPAQPQQPKR